VDSGLVRRSVFDPATGMSRLETQRISRASADQRQGRAGRVEAGVCYRAWSEGAQRSLAPFSPPEITDAALTPLSLDLANWGVRDATDLRWLDAPPAAMLASARDLLAHLGALDSQGRAVHTRWVTLTRARIPELDLDFVPDVSRPLEVLGDRPAVGVSNSFGFGGHNAVLVLEAA